MNSLRRLCLPMLALACLVGPLSLSAHAQVKTPQAMNKEATKLMEANKWPEALAVLSECTGIFDGRAPTLYGPQFGITWFRRGICELKLGQWEAAANSFEKCYDRYRNTEDALSKNPFEKRALLQWGNAAVGAEQWSKALELYEKFLKERNKERDKFLPGPFFINLGLSHLKLGDLDEGLKHFGTALRNKERYRTPQSGIIRTFRALVEAVIGQPDEEAKLLGFLDEYRGSIMSEPFEMASLARLFLGLGIQTFEAGLSKSTV
jgi:tetratricopeptide (TPR) repeat protein